MDQKFPTFLNTRISVKNLKIILLGPPGSGKGTQAPILADALKLTHLATGNILRKEITASTKLGILAKNKIEHGELLDDVLIANLMIDATREEKGYILDGFPRTLGQAEEYHKTFPIQEKTIAIALQVDDEKLIQRICNRLVCKTCQTPYGKENNKQTPLVKCVTCGGPLVQRKDDQLDVVKRRLDIYHQQTSPLLDYYEKKGRLIKIDGNQDPDRVFASIVHELELDILSSIKEEDS